MDEFSEFLRYNTSKRISAIMSKKYRLGVGRWDLLENIDPSAFDRISYARFAYVRNLVLSRPTEFQVPTELGTAERSLMYCSFGAYKAALSALDLPIISEVIGAEAIRRSGAATTVLVARLQNTASQTTYDYEYDGLTFPNYQVNPLSHNELLHLYIKIKELESRDDNREITRSHILAFLHRALFKENEMNEAFYKAFSLIKADLKNEALNLENLLENPVNLTEDIFSSPITFTYQLKAQLGRSLMAGYDFNSAYDVFSGIPLYDERIECLVAMKKPELAAKEIHEYIGLIGNADERSDQILLSNLHIKLGYIYQDPSYFDIAASFFCSAKPHQLKGLFLFKRKMFAESAAAFEAALKITPNNEEIRFSYACTLVELNRISEALKIFRLLKAENPQDENISKNLSYCFYKLKDIENTLITLKSIALNDPPAMKQLLYISIQNDRLDHIRWALQHACLDASIVEVVNYLVYTDKIGATELRGILGKNIYFDTEEIEKIFANTA